MASGAHGGIDGNSLECALLSDRGDVRADERGLIVVGVQLAKTTDARYMSCPCSESSARRSQVFSRICARADVSPAAHHYMSWPTPRYRGLSRRAGGDHAVRSKAIRLRAASGSNRAYRHVACSS